MKKSFVFSLAFILASLTSFAQGKVTMFEDINYGGAACTFRNSLSDLRQTCGGWNDKASSVSIPTGYTVVFYEHINYEGRSWTFTSDITNFVSYDLNDKPSSIRVYYNGKLQ
jgi:hypothetical protein